MVVASGDHGIESEMRDLRESDREVLELLRNEPSSAVGFQGLKRRLGLHPEKLSRALRRLARDDLVEKTELGYRIGDRARTLLSPTAMKPATPSIPILQTFLPPEVDLQGLATYLRGKWFGPLRWYGLMETSEELTLSWLSEDDAIQIDARLRTGALSIDAHFSEASQFPAATMAGHELFQHIAQAYGRVRMNG
jgi:hypothetical protein